MYVIFFFFNDTATTEIYTLSLHDALPILAFMLIDPLNRVIPFFAMRNPAINKIYANTIFGQVNITIPHNITLFQGLKVIIIDRKSTRLNSSHANISYAVFCLKKKINTHTH